MQLDERQKKLFWLKNVGYYLETEFKKKILNAIGKHNQMKIRPSKQN